MNWFQLVTLPLVALLFLQSLRGLSGGSRSRRAAWLGMMVWLAAGAAIWQPDWTTQIAAAVGIGRGADLLLYVVVICAVILTFYFYRRVQKLDAAITEIVRHASIEQGLRLWPVSSGPQPPEDRSA
jgi:hypothetical protein